MGSSHKPGITVSEAGRCSRSTSLRTGRPSFCCAPRARAPPRGRSSAAEAGLVLTLSLAVGGDRADQHCGLRGEQRVAPSSISAWFESPPLGETSSAANFSILRRTCAPPPARLPAFQPSSRTAPAPHCRPPLPPARHRRCWRWLPPYMRRCRATSAAPPPSSAGCRRNAQPQTAPPCAASAPAGSSPGHSTRPAPPAPAPEQRKQRGKLAMKAKYRSTTTATRVVAA